MSVATYYLTWPDQVTTLIVVENGQDGRPRVRISGRQTRIEKTLHKRPIPTGEAEIRMLCADLGAEVMRIEL